MAMPGVGARSADPNTNRSRAGRDRPAISLSSRLPEPSARADPRPRLPHLKIHRPSSTRSSPVGLRNALRPRGHRAMERGSWVIPVGESKPASPNSTEAAQKKRLMTTTRYSSSRCRARCGGSFPRQWPPHIGGRAHALRHAFFPSWQAPATIAAFHEPPEAVSAPDVVGKHRGQRDRAPPHHPRTLEIFRGHSAASRNRGCPGNHIEKDVPLRAET